MEPRPGNPAKPPVRKAMLQESPVGTTNYPSQPEKMNSLSVAAKESQNVSLTPFPCRIPWQSKVSSQETTRPKPIGSRPKSRDSVKTG